MKWLYRMESTDPNKGLWYNSKGSYVFGIGEIENCESKNMPMGYDERYQQEGKSWYSACTKLEDLTHWYSIENAKDLMSKGFKFFRYLAYEYVEYEKETVFLKESVIDKVEMTFDEVFNEGVNRK